jgi:hypothetical protein
MLTMRPQPRIFIEGSKALTIRKDRDDLPPLVKRHLFEGNDGVVPGAVNQDIYSASLGTNRIRKATRVVVTSFAGRSCYTSLPRKSSWLL